MQQPTEGAPPPSEEGTPASFWREAGAAFALIFRSPLAVFLFYNLTFLASLFAMYGAEIQPLAILHSRRTTLWRMLTALAPAVLMTTLGILLGDLERFRSAWPRTRRARMTVALCITLGLPIALLPFLAQYLAWKEDPYVASALSDLMPGPGLPAKMIIVSLVGLTISTLLAAGILGIHTQLIDRLRQLRHRAVPSGSGALEEDVRWYLQHDSQLKLFLTLCAITVGSSILSMGALRNLLNYVLYPSSGSEQTLQTGAVLGYGVYYTGLIASIYLPAHKSLKDVGHLLAEQLLQQSPEAPTNWKQRYEEQQTARAWLGLEGSGLQELQQGLSVLTPLLASLSALVLGPGE